MLRLGIYLTISVLGVAQLDFQPQWAALMGLLGDGAGAADMFCRVLVAIDEDIVSLDIPRPPQGVQASMEFKVGLYRLWGNLSATS